MIQHPAIFTAVRDAIFLADIDTGMIVDANPAAEALSGRTLAELQLLHHTQLHPPEVERLARRGFKKDSQTPGLTEGLILHKDGHRIPVEISTSHFTAPDGRRMLIGVFRDLTERKLGETKLKESEERFRVTFFQAAVGIAQTDIDGRWLLLNDRFCEMLGWSRAELAGKTYLEVTHPDDREACLTACHRLLSGEISSCSTGKCSVSLVRDEYGRAKYFIAIVEDVTPRIEAERALRQAEQRLILAQSAANLGVWYQEWGSNVISISGEYARLHGLSPDRPAVTRQEWFSTIHPDDRERVDALRREAREGSRIFNAEYRVIWPDGSIHWVMAKGAVLLDDSGQPIRTTGVNMDVTERKQAEAALRESEQQVVSIYNTVRDVIFQLAVELEGRFRFVSVNAAFMKITGLGREAVIGKMVHEVIPEPSLTMVLGKYREAVDKNTIVSWEETTDYPTGRLTGEVTIAPVIDDHGTCTHLVGSVHDITERKYADQALRESEERFRNMADTAPVMLWVTGPDKLFTFVNKTWLDFTGRTLEQELGNGWAASAHPEDHQRWYEAFCSAFDARRCFQLECRLRRDDGEYRSILCSGVPRFGLGGAFAGYIGSTIDITDLQSEQRFRQLAENIDQVFWMLEVNKDQVLYVSPIFEKVWGYSSAAVYQDHHWVLETVHTDDRDRFTAFLRKLKSEPAEESYRIVRPDGSVRWILGRTFPIYDQEGKPYLVAGISEDVTAQREMEEQLRQAHKMEAVGRLAGGIAHDFNNLLTVIGGYSQMLLNSTPAADPSREKLEQILNAANRAGTLTRQLLAFSRRQVWQPRVVNLNRLLTNMEALLRPLIGEHITIETQLDAEVSCVRVDPHQIEQVVMNLAANARDAMPNGGRFMMQVSMANTSALRAKNSTFEAGKYLLLRISDTGCGMDERTRERAFEPFFTTKALGKGTGLGLSTVYGIVRQNQGDIHVSSELGRGTAFDLYFPAVPEREAESELPAAQLPKTTARETILVAEDEPGVRGLVKQTLEQLGYRVLEAADGYEALRVFKQHASQIQIHLLLTDGIMPLMNGQELATRLRSVRPGTRVLYMSGYADEVLAFHGIDRPEMAFIQKPFTATELAEKVDKLLSADRGKSAERKSARTAGNSRVIPNRSKIKFGTSDILAKIRNLLTDEEVSFREMQHKPTHMSGESARARGEELATGAKAILAKADNDFRLFVVPGNTRLDLAAIKRELHVTKLRFATREELLDLTGLVPGSIPPFGEPILPFPLYADTQLGNAHNLVAFNAGVLTISMVISVADWDRVAKPVRFSLAKK
jgi:two-component system, cell cycle sensor histidine kinase and response regulator CckA